MPDPIVQDISVGDGRRPLDVQYLATIRPDSHVLLPELLPVYAEAKQSFLRMSEYGVGLANDLTQGILGQALNTPDSFKVRDCVAELLAEQLIAQPDFLQAWEGRTAGRALQCLQGGTVVNNWEVQANLSPEVTTIDSKKVPPDLLMSLADAGFNVSTMKAYQGKYDRLGTKYWLVGRLLSDSTLSPGERERRISLYVRTLRVAAANDLVDEGIIGEAGSTVMGLVDRMASNLGDHNFNPHSPDQFSSWAEEVQATTTPLLTTVSPDQFFQGDSVADEARDLLDKRIRQRQPIASRL